MSRIRRDRPQVRIADQSQGGLGIEERDPRAAGGACLDNHVAGQEQPDARLRLQRAVGQGRVAGAQDPVGPEVDAQLFAQRGLDVNLSQDAEALFPEELPDLASASLKGSGLSTLKP